MTKTVRRFSAAGPCITLGELLRTTPKFFVYKPRFKEGEKRVGRDRSGLVHTEPCHSCRDHPRTTYPNGYMD